MLKSVTLKNFRKHRDETLTFTPGLNVLRGANESGKTTVLEGIMYAFFGSDALRQALPKTVSRGQPEASLQVCVAFSFDGVEYQIVRSKLGAELTYGESRVTGQKETRKFIETLLGCSCAMATKLLFAGQGDVKGVLSDSKASASSLVETLADLSVIEVLVDKVQEQLPSGNTSVLEAQIASTAAKLEAEPEKPSDTEVKQLSQVLADAAEKLGALERSLPSESDVAEAEAAVQQHIAAQREQTRIATRRAEIQKILAAPREECPVTSEGIEQAVLQVAGLADREKARRAYATKFPKAARAWGGDYASLLKQEADWLAESATLSKKDKELSLAINTATLRKITEKTCAFCEKDLTDVPEVVKRNLAADAQIRSLTAELEAVTVQAAQVKHDLASVRELKDVTQRIQQLAGTYYTLSDDVPPVPTWIGEPPEAEGPVPDVADMRRQLRLHQQQVAQRAALEVEMEGLQVSEVPEHCGAEAVLAGYREAAKAVQAAKQEFATVKAQHQVSEAKYEAACAAWEAACKHQQDAAAQLADLKTALSETVKHNELIKKLRAARPKISAQLWGTVMGAISHYFSQVRQVSSIVERAPDGFRVDGDEVAGLSGSTQDALGLAIRIALSKLFLPNLPFLLLDESFAGADESRQLAGVGLLANSGFEQVLLITHSELPESVADNLIVL